MPFPLIAIVLRKLVYWLFISRFQSSPLELHSLNTKPTYMLTFSFLATLFKWGEKAQGTPISCLLHRAIFPAPLAALGQASRSFEGRDSTFSECFERRVPDRLIAFPTRRLLWGAFPVKTQTLY